MHVISYTIFIFLLRFLKDISVQDNIEKEKEKPWNILLTFWGLTFFSENAT